jgi:hypothetical protein
VAAGSSWTSPFGGALTWALIAHGLVTVALGFSYGHDHHPSEVLVTAALPSVGVALWATRRPSQPYASEGAIAWLAAIASTIAVSILEPGTFLQPGTSRVPLLVLTGAASVIVASYAPEVLRLGGPHAGPSRAIGNLRSAARPIALLVLAFGLGAWLLRASPAPAIDVWTVHQQGADAIVHGRQVYAPGAISASDTGALVREIDIYPYPPLNVVLTAPAYAATGDTRWAQLVSILIGAALLRATAQRRGWRHPVPDLLMACLLFHPRGLFVLEQAWGEPLALPLLGGFTLAWSSGRSRLAAVMLGLLCALKQHYLLYLPALALLPGIGVAGAAIAFATLLATYLPFALSAPLGLWNAVVVHHLKNPFRADSLSITARLADAGIALPVWPGFAASLASFGALAATPRKLGPLLLASSLTFLVFYLLGRQAFCNYYYLLGATWLFAAASLDGSAPRA